jgi:hypothetical protein
VKLPRLPRLPAQLTQGLALRRQLRQGTGLQVAIAEGVDFLNPQAWDAVAAHHGLFMSRDYLRALASCQMPQLRHHYAIAFDDGQPVAIVAMQSLQLGLERLRPQDADQPEKAARLQPRVLVCGNLLSYGLDGVAFGPALAHAKRWHIVAEVLYRVRRADKLQGATQFVLLKDFNDHQFEDSQVLAKLSYSPVPTEPNMVLSLAADWRCHDDYLASLTSKFRSNIKTRVFKPIADAGLTVGELTPDQVAQHASRLQALYLAVQANATLRPLTVNADFWPAMAQLGPQRVRFAALLKGDEVCGFLMVLLDGRQATAAQIGFDRGIAAQGLPLYLRLLHASVAMAIAHGAYQLIFGRTALEPKARLGCKPVPMHLWLRHRQPVINSVAKRFFGLIQHDEAPEIDPFKKSA